MRARVLVPFLTLLLFTAALASGVENTCIPPAPGLPGQSNVPPHWWDASADPPSVDPQPVYHTCLTDPRWVESTAVSYGSGVGEDMLFRVLYDNTSVYLSWWVKSPPFGNPDQNLLYFGFQDTGSGGEPAGDRIVKISLGTATTTEAGGGIALNPSTFRRAVDGTGMAGDANPGWLSNTARVWIHKPVGGNCTQNPPDFWAVQVRIPRANFVTVGNVFKIWYQVYTGTLAMPTVKFTWPRAGADITESPFPVQEVYPDPAGWNTFQFSSGPGDPMCPSAGVSIDWQNIGTNNVPDYRVRYDQVPPAASHPVNTFFARATNHSGNSIPAGGIRGTFRIANWGSMPNWEDGVPIDQLWAPIQCGTDGNPTLTNCGTNVPSSDSLFNNTTATSANDIHFDWALTNAQLAPFASNAKRADNCLLVELSSAMSPGLTFTKRSVKKNMIFGHTSDFVDSAQLSIKGLNPIAPDGRDVYIWVEALNMPQKVDRGAPVPKIPVTGDNPSTPGVVALNQGQQTVSINDDRLLAQLNAQGRLAQSDLDAAMPTYRVHVYHDTGTTRKIGGVDRPVLNAQGAFGYYIAYNPPVIGWRHKLEAAGFTLEELAPNFYRIRKVPNNGTVTLKIYIRSLHEGDQDTPLGGPSVLGGNGRFRVFLDAGPNFPQGDFNTFVDGKLSVNAGLEAFLGSNTSIEGILGYHAFKVPFVTAPHIWQLSLNLKQYFGPGPLHFFLNAGGGAYRFDPGSTTKLGGNVGAGLLWDISSTWGLEGVYNFHTINTGGSKTKFSTLQVGIRHSLF